MLKSIYKYFVKNKVEEENPEVKFRREEYERLEKEWEMFKSLPPEIQKIYARKRILRIMENTEKEIDRMRDNRIDRILAEREAKLTNGERKKLQNEKKNL